MKFRVDCTAERQFLFHAPVRYLLQCHSVNSSYAFSMRDIQAIHMKKYINERTIETLQIPSGKTSCYLLDTELKGFKVTKSYAGTISFSIQYKDPNGIQRQEKIGNYGEMGCPEARTLAAKRLRAIHAYKDTVRKFGQSAVPCTITVSEFFYKTYLPLKKTEVRAWQTQEALFRNHVDPALGNKVLSDVSREDCIALHADLMYKPTSYKPAEGEKQKTLSVATVNRILILVKHMFNIALQRDIPGLKGNPMKIVIHADRSFKARCLTKEEINALIESIDSQGDAHLSTAIRLLLFTGLRRSNVFSLRWGWVNFSEGSIAVPKEFDKAKRGYKIFLSDYALETLKAHQRREGKSGFNPNGYAFANPKTGKPFRTRRSIWLSCTEKAGVAGLRMHDLRHTYATMMLDSGSDITDVQKALGHTQLATTVRYLHINEQRKREKANAAAVWMLPDKNAPPTLWPNYHPATKKPARREKR